MAMVAYMIQRMRVIIVVIILVIIGAAFFLWQKYGGALPALRPAPDITKLLPSDDSPSSSSQNTANPPLKLPPGFSVSIFAKDLPGARVVVFDKAGNMWVSETSQGKIEKLQIQNSKIVGRQTIIAGLKNPHGIAFNDSGDKVYIAEEDKVSYWNIASSGTLEGPHKIADLPSGPGHFTRTLMMHGGKLLVSLGSSCNVCIETDPRRAAILEMNLDGSEQKIFAKGLRNSVFLAENPATAEIWATENGRDNLGDDLPPDEINIIKDPAANAGQLFDYGWPICYAKNIHDDNFDKNQYIHDPCADKVGSFIDLQAHSAPLGLAFVPSSWPPDFQNSLLVAFHGSWNRSVPTGYKVVTIKLDSFGNPSGTQDFITGWITGAKKTSEVLGRPVDLIFDQSGSLYISDDKAGVIYRVWHNGSTSGKSCRPGLACDK